MLRPHKIFGLAAAIVLAGAPALLPAHGSQAALPVPDSPAALSAAWMAGNLAEDGVIRTNTRANLSLTLELGSALAAVDGQDPALGRIRAALERDAAAFTKNGTSTAEITKALSFVTDHGTDPSAVGGLDLLAALEARVDETAISGRLTGDNVSTWVQAYAAKSLTAADSPAADTVVDFTLAQQCSAGFFRLHLASTNDVNQKCDDSSDATRQQSADVTAAVSIHLAPLAAENPSVATALEKAALWLEELQQPDGSFVAQWSGANANSTGLAGWALGSLGHTDSAARAATWLRARQVVGACAPALATESGALAFNDDAWDDGVADGISDHRDRMQWLFVGAQALPALKWAPQGDTTPAITLPETALPGAPIEAVVHGIAPGERACLSGAISADLIGDGTSRAFTFTPTVEGLHTLTLSTSGGPVARTVHVRTTPPVVEPPVVEPPATPAGKLTVKAPRKVLRGSKVRVVVNGARSGEKLRIRVPGRSVTRRANASGTWRGKVRVGTKPARAARPSRGKVVKRNIVVTGLVSKRTAHTTIRLR